MHACVHSCTLVSTMFLAQTPFGQTGSEARSATVSRVGGSESPSQGFHLLREKIKLGFNMNKFCFQALVLRKKDSVGLLQLREKRGKKRKRSRRRRWLPSSSAPPQCLKKGEGGGPRRHHCLVRFVSSNVAKDFKRIFWFS